MRIILFALVLCPSAYAQKFCGSAMETAVPERILESRQLLEVDFPGVEFSTREDASFSTGATLVYFPNNKAIAAVDARGGAVTSVDTTLFGQGTYSQQVDGVVFAGGSSMGLEAHEGVRGAIFRENQRSSLGVADAFDSIACITGACVYDFGARVEPGQDRFAYPRREMGEELFASRESGRVLIGRAGAGISATTNKILRNSVWGGQGAAFRRYPWGRMMAVVVNNSAGELVSLRALSAGNASSSSRYNAKPPKAGRNTTLSLIITDVAVDAGFLQRLVTSSHTAMGGMIVPFQTSTDGDIQFAVSTQESPVRPAYAADLELRMALAARELMDQALTEAAVLANPGLFRRSGRR